MTISAEPTTITSEVKGGWQWLVVHERFLLITLGILLIAFLGWKFLDNRIEVAGAKVATTAKVLADQDATNKTLQQNYLDLSKQQAAVTAQLQAQNTQLQAQTVAAYKQAATQAAADQKLTTTQLAQRLDALTGQQGIQSTPNTVDLTQKQAATASGQLEQIPALQKQVQDDQTFQSNQDKQITGLTTENNSCKLSNQGLEKARTDEANSCKSQIKSIKVANLKTKAKWGAIGFLLGFITGHIY
jgi:hypothetical protein